MGNCHYYPKRARLAPGWVGLFLLLCCASLTDAWAATANPNQVGGSVSWNNNPSGPVGLYLNTLAHGLVGGTIHASDLSGTFLASKPVIDDPTSHLSENYQIDVEAGDPANNIPAIQHNVSPQMFTGDGFTYWFPTQLSGGVVYPPALPDVQLDFAECAGLVDIAFCDPSGGPVTVNTGNMIAYLQSSGLQQAVGYFANASSVRLAVRSGTPINFIVNVTMHTGTDPFTDLFSITHSTNYAITVGCDQNIPLKFVVPPTPGGSDPSSVGKIIGIADMVGEEEHWNNGHRSLLNAFNGPFGNYRYADIDPLTQPFYLTCVGASPQVGTLACNSAGPYELINVLPSNSSTPARDYSVGAAFIFGLGRGYEFFASPVLPAVTVPSLQVGGPVNLGNIFVIMPGFVTGDILLCGPDEGNIANSCLRYVYRDSDVDSNSDGIPDDDVLDGTSRLLANGLPWPGSGASHTAAGGFARVLFEGDFVMSGVNKNNFVGNYNMTLGGLGVGSSHWDQRSLELVFSNVATADPDSYFDSQIQLLNAAFADVEIFPGQTVTNDHCYGMSQVCIGFHTESGVLISPDVSLAGNFNGLNFKGQPATYTSGGGGNGTPTLTGAADGQVVVCIAEGIYNIYPRAYLSSDGGISYSRTTLQPILNYRVPPCVKIKITPEIQMTLANPPLCPTNRLLNVSGAVTSGTNVATIYSELNGGAAVTVCNNCGISPPFSFNILLADCDNTLKVTAIDVNGRMASFQSTIHYDATPPVISGCQDTSAAAVPGLNGAAVNYSVTALDNCDGVLPVNCTPPPLSIFPIGPTAVTCTAVDRCGNTNACQFTITVTNPCPNLVVNGSFETPAIAHNTFGDVTGLSGWTTTEAEGKFDLWSGNFGGMTASDGIQHLEINADEVVTTVSQVITNLDTNCPVTFCFDYRGRFGLSGSTPNNDFRVTVSGGYSFSVTLNPAAGGWFTFCTNFVPTSPVVTIAFRGAPHSTDNGPGGAHIDNVSMTQCCSTNCPDLWVDVTATYPGPKLVHIRGPNTPCCGSDFVYHLKYGNKGGAPVSGATISFSFPASPLCSVVSIKTCQNAPYLVNSPPVCPPTIPSSGLENFTLPTLNPGDHCNIAVRVHLCCDVTNACTNQPLLTAQATILPLLSDDCNLLNNVSTHARRPCCSYDPNDCTVTPKGCGPEGFIHRDQALTYLVQFQNEGSANAQVVVVRNDLDEDLDLDTFEDLGGSHDYYLQQNGRELLFIFPDIQLPPQSVDEKASSGFAKFRIRPRANAPIGTVITNGAGIYFDANDPVITVTTVNTITEDPVPVASFLAAARPGSDAKVYDFTYTGGTANASHVWYFGPDATPMTSTAANPSGVIFQTAGSHLVSLETSLGDCVAEPAVQRITAGRPQLSINRTAAGVRLSWAGSGYRVQEATDLTAPIQWNLVVDTSSEVGGWYSVQLPPPTGTRFYRLVSAP